MLCLAWLDVGICKANEPAPPTKADALDTEQPHSPQQAILVTLNEIELRIEAQRPLLKEELNIIMFWHGIYVSAPWCTGQLELLRCFRPG